MRNKKVVRTVQLGLLCALSVILMFTIRFSIFPAAPFLEYDMADVPILIGTFMFGPAWGLAITCIVSVLQWLIVSPHSGWVGAIMHIFSTGAYVVAAGLIYRRNRTRKGAAWALAVGSVAMIIAMVPMNILVSPLYLLTDELPYAQAQAEYIDRYFWYSAAFNCIKAAINTLITFVLYKSVAKALRLMEPVQRPQGGGSAE
ncbi:MAG: ECF transporter S component [Clostridia bacterium]|nr:ECF transporter S component [Clostridia bacterium]